MPARAMAATSRGSLPSAALAAAAGPSRAIVAMCDAIAGSKTRAGSSSAAFSAFGSSVAECRAASARAAAAGASPRSAAMRESRRRASATSSGEGSRFLKIRGSRFRWRPRSRARPRAAPWSCVLLFAALSAPRRPHAGGMFLRPRSRARPRAGLGAFGCCSPRWARGGASRGPANVRGRAGGRSGLVHRAGTRAARIAARAARARRRGPHRAGAAGAHREGRELARQRLAAAGRTGRRLGAADQRLEPVLAPLAAILVDRHTPQL